MWTPPRRLQHIAIPNAPNRIIDDIAVELKFDNLCEDVSFVTFLLLRGILSLVKDKKVARVILSKLFKMNNETKKTLFNLQNLRSDLRNEIIDMIPEQGFFTITQRLKNMFCSLIRRLCIFEPVFYFSELD